MSRPVSKKLIRLRRLVVSFIVPTKGSNSNNKTKNVDVRGFRIFVDIFVAEYDSVYVV